MTRTCQRIFGMGSWNVCHEEESSNWREAANLTLRVEELAEAGKLDGKELWIFTDNSMYEVYVTNIYLLSMQMYFFSFGASTSTGRSPISDCICWQTMLLILLLL